MISTVYHTARLAHVHFTKYTSIHRTFRNVRHIEIKYKKQKKLIRKKVLIYPQNNL